MTTSTYDKISVGDEAELRHTITESDVERFAMLTGDYNPVHMDEAFCEKTPFRNRVVHGMLSASFLSTLIGTRLPGPGALWFEQQFRFLVPVRIGEELRVWAKVKHKSDIQQTIVLQTEIYGDGGRKVIDGEAKVKILSLDSNPVSSAREVEAVVTEKAKPMPPTPSASGKGAIVVTGASRGIGAAIARKLSSAGFPVVINFSSDETGAAKVLQDIQENGGTGIIFKADIKDDGQLERLVEATLNKFGSVYGLVNNASGSVDAVDFENLNWDMFDRHIKTQVKAAFRLSQMLIPHFLKNQSGSIVNIGSTQTDNLPPLKSLPYTMAKSALNALTRGLAVEFGPKGIRVNTVSPGMTNTDLIANFPDKSKMMFKMQSPTRRLSEPEEVAAAVAYLMSDGARQVTGQNIRICGGNVMA